MPGVRRNWILFTANSARLTLRWLTLVHFSAFFLLILFSGGSVCNLIAVDAVFHVVRSENFIKKTVMDPIHLLFGSYVKNLQPFIAMNRNIYNNQKQWTWELETQIKLNLLFKTLYGSRGCSLFLYVFQNKIETCIDGELTLDQFFFFRIKHASTRGADGARRSSQQRVVGGDLSCKPIFPSWKCSMAEYRVAGRCVSKEPLDFRCMLVHYFASLIIVYSFFNF